MKKFFLFLIVFFTGLTSHFLLAQEEDNEFNLTNTPKFNPKVLEKYLVVRTVPRFEPLLYYNQLPNFNFTLEVNLVFPNFTITPYANTGIGFLPFTNFYGGGLNFKVLDFLIGAGYLGYFEFNFRDSDGEDGLYTLRVKQEYSNLGFVDLGFDFFFINIKNRTSYGQAKIEDIVLEDGELVDQLGEQIINNADINITLWDSVGYELKFKMDLDYEYFFKEQVSHFQYFVNLNSTFKFENNMQVALVPNFSLAYSSAEDKIKNYLLTVPDNLSTDYIIGLDILWRIFPFNYDQQINQFKNIFIEPALYTDLLINSDNSEPLAKSELSITPTVNLGIKNPYNNFSFFFGFGWNNITDGFVFNPFGFLVYF